MGRLWLRVWVGVRVRLGVKVRLEAWSQTEASQCLGTLQDPGHLMVRVKGLGLGCQGQALIYI